MRAIECIRAAALDSGICWFDYWNGVIVAIHYVLKRMEKSLPYGVQLTSIERSFRHLRMTCIQTTHGNRTVKSWSVPDYVSFALITGDCSMLKSNGVGSNVVSNVVSNVETDTTFTVDRLLLCPGVFTGRFGWQFHDMTGSNISDCCDYDDSVDWDYTNTTDST